MSAKLVGRALEVRGLTHSEKLTLVALADVSNSQTGICWPSLQWLGGVVERSPRQIRRLVRSLEARGFVETSERPGTSSTYVVFPEPIDDSEPRTPVTDLPRTPTSAYPGHAPDIAMTGTPVTQMSADPEGTCRTAPRCESCGHVSFAGHRCQEVAV